MRGDDPHRHDVEPGEHEARDERRRIELDQRLLGDDRIDRDQHRGRNQHVERAGRGHRAGREGRVVAVPPHLRDRDLRERRRGRDRRAADRAEQRAGADRGIRQRAADAGEHRVAGLEQLGRHVAARGDRAHQDEQRNDRQRIGAGELIGHEAEHLQRRRPAVDRGVAEEARGRERHRDRHAQEDQHQQQGDAEQADRRRRSSLGVLRARASAMASARAARRSRRPAARASARTAAARDPR